MRLTGTHNEDCREMFSDTPPKRIVAVTLFCTAGIVLYPSFVSQRGVFPEKACWVTNLSSQEVCRMAGEFFASEIPW